MVNIIGLSLFFSRQYCCSPNSSMRTSHQTISFVETKRSDSQRICLKHPYPRRQTFYHGDSKWQDWAPRSPIQNSAGAARLTAFGSGNHLQKHHQKFLTAFLGKAFAQAELGE